MKASSQEQTQKNVSIVKRLFLEGFSGGNLDVVEEVMSPDIDFQDADSSDEMDVLIKGRNYPADSLTTLSTSSLTSSTQQAFVRCRSRQAALRFETSGSGYGWRLGYFRMDTRLDGRQ